MANKTIDYVKISAAESTELSKENLNFDAQYVRLEIDASKDFDRTLLSQNQYIWVDRTIRAKIALAPIEGLERLVRMDVRELDGISDEVFEVAKCAFKKDRRFFLSMGCEEEIGHPILQDYIRQYEEVPKLVLGCFYKDELVGVLIAIKLSDTEYETVLGAILPQWQSKGAGVSLYASEFNELRKRGVKTLYSRISTDNVASLNMHISLSKGNISFVQPYDIYIKN